MPFPWMAAAAMGAAGLGFLGQRNANRANASSAQAANQANAFSSDKQMAFQREMSSTAYQRAVADMRLAGINPILAYSQGGASAPSGSSFSSTPARSENVFSNASNSARDAMMMKAQLDNANAEAFLKKVTAAKTATETDLLNTTRGKEKFYSDLYGTAHSAYSSVKSAVSSSKGFFDKAKDRFSNFKDDLKKRYSQRKRK